MQDSDSGKVAEAIPVMLRDPAIPRGRVLASEPASPDECLYFRVAEEIKKRELPFLNEVLRQLVTLNVSLLGGGIFFLTPQYCDNGPRLVAMFMFLVGLLCA